MHKEIDLQLQLHLFCKKALGLGLTNGLACICCDLL